MYPMRKKSMTLTFVRLRTKPEIKRRLFIFFSSFSTEAGCGLTILYVRYRIYKEPNALNGVSNWGISSCSVAEQK